MKNFESNLNLLIEDIRSKRIIGVRLIDILDETPEFSDFIHQLSRNEIDQAIRSVTGHCDNPEFVLISTTIIAMQYYNKEIWQHIYDVYEIEDTTERRKKYNCILDILDQYERHQYKDTKREIRLLITMHSIVPKNYLLKFFDFVEYIFKEIFYYSLPDDVEEELSYVFQTLNKMNADTNNEIFDIKDKTYHLLKGTTKLMSTKRWYGLDALIKFSNIVLKIIDDIYYSNEKKYNSYFDETVNSYKMRSDLQHSRANINKQNFSSWKPIFKRINTNIYLVTRMHNIKEQYDIDKVRIEVYAKDNLLYSYNSKSSEFQSLSILGGNQIKQINIKLENPLEQISYKVSCDNVVLYNSKEELHRDCIIFDSENNEISNFKPYEGNVTICYFDAILRFDQRIVKQDELLKYKDIVVFFGDKLICGIDGKQFIFSRNVEIYRGNDKINIYQEVNSLILEEKDDDKIIVVRINNMNYKFTDLEYTKINFNSINYIKLELGSFVKIGYNEIILISQSHKTSSYELIYSNLFDLNDSRNKDNIITTVNCDIELFDKFKCNKEYYTTNINKYNYLSLYNNSVEFRIHFEIPMFKLYSSWEFFYDRTPFIWVKNISQTSVLLIRSLKIEGAILYDQDGKYLEEITLYKKNNAIEIPLKTILNYNFPSFVLSLIKDGQLLENINVISQNIYHTDEFNININELNEFEIYTPYDGYDDISIKVYEVVNDNLVDEKLTVDSTFISKFNLGMGKFYKFKLELRIPSGDLLSLINPVIYESNFKKFVVTDNAIINKSFSIREINPNEYSTKVYNHWIDIKYYDEATTYYVGEMYKLQNGDRIDMNFLDCDNESSNLCYIEFLNSQSDKNNEIEVYVNDLDCDGLCYNRNTRTFTNNPHDEFVEILKVQLRRPR